MLTENLIQNLPLFSRLQTVCALIGASDTLADIGCDHGKVSEYVVKNNVAKRLIVNDISLPSLQKAKALLAHYSEEIGEQSIQIEYVCCDGAALATPQYQPIDTVVIAGFGGHELLKIVESIQPKYAILEPQTAAGALRQGLHSLGYTLEADVTVLDKNKFYDVIKAVKTDTLGKTPNDCMLAYGYFYQNPQPYLKQRLQRDAATIATYPANDKHTKKLQIIQEVLQWQP